jgi:F-type H+-transporting ATPase subunit alpha
VGISVSRVGGNAQTKATKQVAGKLKMDLAQYYAMAAFAQFASDLDKASQQQLSRGQRMVELLKQPQYAPMAMEEQVAVFYAGGNGFVDDLPLGDVKRFELEMLDYLRRKHAPVLQEIREKNAISKELFALLDGAIKEFKAQFK